MEKVTLHADYTPLRASDLTKPNHLRGVPTAPDKSWKGWTKPHGDMKTAKRFPEKPRPPVVARVGLGFGSRIGPSSPGRIGVVSQFEFASLENLPPIM